jgi:hypothetical protein
VPCTRRHRHAQQKCQREENAKQIELRIARDENEQESQKKRRSYRSPIENLIFSGSPLLGSFQRRQPWLGALLRGVWTGSRNGRLMSRTWFTFCRS